MIPDGYKEYNIKINGYNTKVYKLRKSSKYSLMIVSIILGIYLSFFMFDHLDIIIMKSK